MREVAVEVELENAIDRDLVVQGIRQPGEVRAVRTRVFADTGAVMLVLPQDLVEALGLRQKGKAFLTDADDRKEERPLAGIVTVRVGSRETSVNCVVGPLGTEPVLGEIVLEALDLLVDCASQKLVPRPESPFLPMLKLK